MSSAVPPKPTPKPGRVKVYRALYDYTARSSQEMSFEEGDLLYVSDKGPNDDWLPASCGGKRGLVPSNYVISENVSELPNPLHDAAKRGNIEFLKDCLNNEVSVNSLDKSGSTALYWACHGGHEEIVNILLDTPNINVSSQNKIGDCPLHAAAWKGHILCIKMLIERGANIWVRNQEQKTALDMTKDVEIAAILQQEMRKNTRNEDEENAYEADSDND